MKSRLLTAAAVFAVLGAVLVGAAGLSAPASATTVEFTFDFGVVLPGETRTAEHAFATPVDSVVAAVDIIGPMTDDLGVFSTEVCPLGSGCVAFDELLGLTLPAGSYVVRVNLDVADAPAAGDALTSAWRLTLHEQQGGGLTSTGAAADSAGFIAAALFVLGTGVLLIAVLRRRRGAES